MQSKEPSSSKGLTIGLALIGAIFGLSLQDDAAGFLGGAALGALFAQVLNLRQRLRLLQQKLDQLSAAEAPIRSTAPLPQPAPMPAPAEKATPPSPSPSVTPAVETSRPRVSVAPQPAPVRERSPSAIDLLAQRAIAWLKGGNPLARVGILILFLGGVFLAKYAAENSLFPIELRFVALAAGALALLGIGWRLRARRPVYAQLLQGGGIAGFYLTVFAATKLFGLVPFTLAFALMVLVALAAAVLAVAQNSLALAVIGTTGGFLTPILLSTGSGNHVALFSYYAILNLGIFTIAWYRTWRLLNVIGFVFTFTITALWRGTSYEPSDLASADAFLILFFLMYVGVSILSCVRQPPNLKGYVSGSLVFGLPVVAFALHASLVARIEYALAWSAFTLGAFYLLLGWTLWRSGRDTFRLLVEAFAALGVIFGSLAIPLAFDTRTTAAMWAVEGAGLLWLGVRQDRKLARAFGALLQAAAGLGYLSRVDTFAMVRPVLNTATLGAAMLAVSGMCSGWWLYANRARVAAYERGAHYVFALWATGWWLFGGMQEVSAFLDRSAFAVALGFVALSCAGLTAVARRTAWPFPQSIALYLPALAIVVALAHVTSVEHPAIHFNAIGWAAIFAAHYGVLRVVDASSSPALPALHAFGFVSAVLLIAWEANWQVAQVTIGVWPAIVWGVAGSLGLAWLGRRDLRPVWPIAAHADTYRVFAAVPIAIALLLWIASINLTNSGNPGWLPYVPLINPQDVAVAVALAAIGLWWNALDSTQRLRVWPFDARLLIALAAALVFIWLNAALIRSLHHNFGAPITFYGLTRSTLVQASLSIFWGVLGFAAMTLGARQRWRYVWIAGAALMAVVVGKLFLVDFSSIGTVARIASFLSVGVLLLVTGYLAPLPPRRGASEAAG